MKLVFIGCTRLSYLCLDEILKSGCVDVSGILTNKSEFSISYRPEGVTNVMYADLCVFAERHTIPCRILDSTMGDPSLVSWIKERSPDIIIVAGWYHKIPEEILDIAPCYGIHASLLPDYSGGAPLVWAIINGEKKTGVTLFKMDKGVDSGPIVGQSTFVINKNDTIASLYSRAENVSLELLKKYIPRIINGNVSLKTQDESKRRRFPQRRPEDGLIDWGWSANQIYDFIRAQTKPYPGAYTHYRNEKITIWESIIIDDYNVQDNYGIVKGGIIDMIDDQDTNGILVATSDRDRLVLITQVGIKSCQSLPANQLSDLMTIKIGDKFG